MEREMAVTVVIDVPNGNQQFYDQLIPTLGAAS
jgi:hypothetical protein